MKKFFLFFTAIAFSLTSCSSDGEIGPTGPQGPQGPPGEDGLIGTVFDVENVDFTAANDYSIEVEYSDYTDVPVFESDVVLVYLKVGEDGEADGEPVDIWRLLPQTYYVEGGTMQYNFDYTFFSAFIFLDASIALADIEPVFTEDQVFRVAIMPATLANSTAVDFADYNAVMSVLEKTGTEIPTVEIK